MEQYIPQNTNEETKVDVDALTTAMLDTHLVRNSGERRPTLSKYDFVSEVLTLIHVSPTVPFLLVSLLP